MKYCAPELPTLEDKASFETDMFALGVTIIEMAAEHPFLVSRRIFLLAATVLPFQIASFLINCTGANRYILPMKPHSEQRIKKIPSSLIPKGDGIF